MKITVLFFGITTDVVESNSLEFILETDITVGRFKNELKKKYPQLSNINSYAIAVNEDYATDEISLKEGDIVAIIPPVSGG